MVGALEHVDGVMMGCAAYQEPWRLIAVDPLIFGEAADYFTKAGGGGASFLTSNVNWNGVRDCIRSPAIYRAVPRSARSARLPPPTRQCRRHAACRRRVFAAALTLVRRR